MTRSLRLLLTIALALAIALAMTACSSPSDESQEPAEETSADETSADETSGEAQGAGPTSDEDLSAALEAEYGTTEWYPRVQSIGADQVLLARVIRVETDLEMGESSAASEIANAVASIVESEEAVNIQVVSADGTASTGQSWGSEMGDVMDLPPAPTSAEELQSWIDTVYGESGEDWYSRVESFGVSDSESGWQGMTVVVIETDLSDRSEESLVLARRMGEAVTSSGQTISQSYVVKMGTGEQLLSGDLPSVSLSY
jgi:hypothetical protein